MNTSTNHNEESELRPRRSRHILARFPFLFTAIALAAGSYWSVAGGKGAVVTQVRLETFQQPEVVPNVALDDPQPVKNSRAVLRRHEDRIKATLTTRGLPAGVYTFWWHLEHLDGEVSILWAGNDIVSDKNGNGKLVTTLEEGEENAPGAIFIGHGLQLGAAMTVDVELWVRYHGLPSEDPEALAEQLTLPFGGCTDVRNTNPRPGDYPCWNPQRAVFGTR